MPKKGLSFFILIALVHLAAPHVLFSQQLNFNVDLSLSDPARLDIRNNGGSDLSVVGVDYLCNGIAKTNNRPFTVAPGASGAVTIALPRPVLPGSYNVSAKLKVMNGGKSDTFVYNYYIQYEQAADLDIQADVTASAIVESGTITVAFQDPSLVAVCSPVFPDELVITDRAVAGNSIVYSVRNTRPEVSATKDLYWIFEREAEIQSAEGARRVHQGGWLRIAMALGRDSRPFQQEIGRGSKSVDRNFVSYDYLSTGVVIVLTVIAFLFFIVMSLFYRGREKLIPLMYVAFTFFLVNLLILIFQIPFNFNPEFETPELQLSPLQFIWRRVTIFNLADNFLYFRNFILPVYYIAVTVYLMYSYSGLKKLRGEELWHRLQEKKTWRIFAFLYARIRRLLRKPYDERDAAWNADRRTAFLAIMVKFFWMPLLWSWTINNIFVMIEQILNMRPDFYRINEFAVNLIILLDVAIFAFSYTVESKKTKSMIKSVEPTVLGWLVGIACYPPFNQFTFFWLDTNLNWMPNFELSEPVRIAAFVAVTVCWAFYASATVALGFKSSNLTNRGIVTRFPYNIVRHPAYLGKNLLWLIEFFLLSQKHLGLVLGFLVIYTLRAWTEERHLEMDPDYVAYMKKVKYRFIPGII